MVRLIPIVRVKKGSRIVVFRYRDGRSDSARQVAIIAMSAAGKNDMMAYQRGCPIFGEAVRHQNMRNRDGLRRHGIETLTQHIICFTQNRGTRLPRAFDLSRIPVRLVAAHSFIQSCRARKAFFRAKFRIESLLRLDDHQGWPTRSGTGSDRP